MSNKAALTAHYLFLVALLFSVAWAVSAPNEWEPRIAVLTALAAFIGTDVYRIARSPAGAAPAGGLAPPAAETFAQINWAFGKYADAVTRKELKVHRAELVQHSSERASNLVIALAKSGADIELLVQEPETVRKVAAPVYAVKVQKNIEDYPKRLRRVSYKGEFKLYAYKTPASVDGVRLHTTDNKVILILGWYAYYRNGLMTSLTESDVGGGENPCVVITTGHPDLDNFNEFFEDFLDSCRSQSAHPALHVKGGEIVGGS
ncbi:MAG TPA: hypothetical protein VEY09_07595 [Pyrinomonadaceae bacterium]|nr:hypothetical protein [Pyrinomonadaceae bacterium]